MLAGLRELEAGQYEGRPEADAVDYFAANPKAAGWTLTEWVGTPA